MEEAPDVVKHLLRGVIDYQVVRKPGSALCAFVWFDSRTRRYAAPNYASEGGILVGGLDDVADWVQRNRAEQRFREFVS